MKAWEIDGFGIDRLRLVERPEANLAAGQVLVRVQAVSLNFRDLLVVKGQYNPRMTLPRVPCSDAAGTVLALGPHVSRVKVGDRVCGIFMQRWLEGELSDSKARSTLGGDLDGTLAELIVLSEEGVVPVPEHLSFEEAATLPCAAVTAWNALAEGQLRAGETVLLQGTGGVSIIALQLARAFGATALITSGSDEKLARALKLGAHVGVNYRTEPDWEKWVRRQTDRAGVDHVVEVGGAGTLEKSFKAVRTGGHIALIGVLSGSGTVDPLPVLMRGLRLRGIFVGSRQMFEALNRAITANKILPVIDRVFGFHEAPAAFTYLESGQHFGKVVIRTES